MYVMYNMTSLFDRRSRSEDMLRYGSGVIMYVAPPHPGSWGLKFALK